MDTSARDERQRRQQDQTGGEDPNHDVELGGVQRESYPCIVRAAGCEDAADQTAAQPDIENLYQMRPQLPAEWTAEQTVLDPSPASPPRP